MSAPYWSDDAVTLWHGDALALPLEDATVDLVVTSPPYFGLRSYQDGGEHYAGQIGAEATPAEFVDALIAATAEMMRVVKPSGSIWVNLGDKYAGSRMDGGSGWATAPLDHDPKKAQLSRLAASQGVLRTRTTVPTKSLIGVPWRYALRCIDDLGLILRAEVIWSKPNGLPESVTDRVRRSHETWFHFTKEPRYYSAVDEIREATSSSGKTWEQRKAEGVTWTPGIGTRGTHMEPGQVTNGNMAANPLGKLPGSVWTIATQPLTVPAHLGVDHFAAFPMEWPRRIITGWSPAGVCTACGEGRRPVAQQTDVAYAAERARVRANRTQRTERENALGESFGGVGGRTNTEGFGNISNGVVKPSYAITGYACACPDTTAPTTPGVVLDPFSGTGTTALMAKVLGRRGVGVDLSADYCRLARWRVNDPGQIASAMQVEKVAPPMDDQGVLDFGASA